MPFTQTFPNGQTLTSSAMSDDDMTSLMQLMTCNAFGLLNKQEFSATFDNTNQVVLDDITGIQAYFKVTGDNIPAKTIVQSINAGTKTLTLSNAVPVTGQGTLQVTNPLAGRLVRQEWPAKGAPAWDKTDDVAFLRAVETDDWYNKVRDQGSEALDSTSGIQNTEYTRVWRVSWNMYGPNAYQRATLLKSALLLDFIHDKLQPFNIFIVPSISNPRRSRELFEGQWWSRADVDIDFYEQVNESIVTPTVASVEVLVLDDDGIQIDLNIGV